MQCWKTVSLTVTDDNMIELRKIFLPTLHEQAISLRDRDCNFAYYTTASTALKIIKNKEIWLRNASVVNDYSEIKYGRNLLNKALKTQSGLKFKNALDSIQPNLFESTIKNFESWYPRVGAHTFICCLSEHDPLENENGRLSMWRAYGDIALVIRKEQLLNESMDIGVYSLLVNYWTETECEAELSKVADQIKNNFNSLKSKGNDFIQRGLYNLFLHFTIGTKHPGFSEEQELRVYSDPSRSAVSKKIVQEIVDIDGVPQEVMKLPLIDDPQNGFSKLDIPNLLYKLIIGPTQFPYAMGSAFAKQLQVAGMASGYDKIKVSKIPVRSIS